MNEEPQLPLVREKFLRREWQSIPAARQFAREALADWGWSGPDDPLLCVSELATNALLHGVPPGRGFLLRLTRDAHADGDPHAAALRIEVHDSGPGSPRIPDAADESGRGLCIVEALADKWGVGGRDPGKVVWCEFTARHSGLRAGDTGPAYPGLTSGRMPAARP
ncbi:ATP-binding protein [Streptomyces sp. TRM66268-LWL]|uniref:ATP-binding protein n=1 Tax=Streptomyces polyasparticus TaxID=2767826 RepID=A0ABR7SQ28_9ACTN|nr:ATP-binding protein [Streptomyces polyasparticus]MBC9716949.1 ATP-binding protein [Streptomyces polyasparticus]